MFVLKWNYKTHEYDPYDLPDGAITYSSDMDKDCVCAQCGKKIKFGYGYASREIHTPAGFGYIVCEDCNRKEVERAIKARKEGSE